MKLETLSRRLAEKAGCPELEAAILDKSALPDRCLIWTGAVQFREPKLRLKRVRDRENLPSMAACIDRPRPVIQYQGKRVSVRALIYRLIYEPDPEPLLRSLDGCHPLCVHPMHCDVIEREPEAPPEEPEELVLSDDWTEEEVHELVEILLTEQQPQSWEDVVAAPLLEGAPEAMLRQVLIDLGKEHLT